LMQGVYCCLRNFSFLFLPLTLLNSFDAHSLLSNYPHSSQFFWCSLIVSLSLLILLMLTLLNFFDAHSLSLTLLNSFDAHSLLPNYPQISAASLYYLLRQKYISRVHCTYLGLARTIYIRCKYGNFGREITKYAVIYGVYIRFWPTLHITAYMHTHTGISFMFTHCHWLPLHFLAAN
jgi:hypothetical protein